MTARKASASATGGRMLNPSVEPKARRESTQAKRDSEGKTRRNSAGRTSRDNTDSVKRRSEGVDVTDSATTAAAALEARNQRRSIGLKRLSVNDHMKETLINAVEDAARRVGMTIQTTGIEKLQDIMTEAKEKGLGVSKLFQFFLLQADPSAKRGSLCVERKGSLSTDVVLPEEANEPADVPGPEEGHGGGVFKETLSSKTRAEQARTSRAKKKSMELMPSLQKSKRPSTASSKRGSSSSLDPGHPETSRMSKDDDQSTKAGDDSIISSARRRSLSRRSSSAEELLVRDRRITTGSFHCGLATLGFKLTDEEVSSMFRHLDDNGDGMIDLAEFTRFCLQIPSIAWKAERARRGVLAAQPGADADRGLEKAARDIANEAMTANDAGDGLLGGASGEGRKSQEPAVELGRTVFKGEKFFWRTQDLIDIVIQLNAKEGFIAISTFHTGSLQVYPILFVDPAKIPVNATAIAERIKELEAKELEAKQAAQMAGILADSSRGSPKESTEVGDSEKQTLAQKAHMQYISDYLVHRITMPDQNGHLLQPDVTQPGVQVNPDIPSESSGHQEGTTTGADGVAAIPRPGLMRTTFDEWDTLLFPKPPSNVEGAPVFAKTKKRESYFKEFQNKTGEFDDNRIKAHRFSAEAAAYTEEVSNLMRKLAPLNYSASAPTVLLEDPSTKVGDPLADVELNARPGSGRIVLDDGLSQGTSSRRGSSRNDALLESQSAPVLPTQENVEA